MKEWASLRRGEMVALVELAHVEADLEQPADLLSLMQRHTRVHAAVAKLSPLRRRLVSIAFLEGLSHHEVAHVTGLALGTVKSHLRRALIQLREELEGM